MIATAEPSIQFADVVYGGEVPLDDLAENYHEASRLYPSTALARMPGLALLESEPQVFATVERSSRLHRQRPAIELPAPRRLRVRLDRALGRRASAPPVAPARLRLVDVSTLLAAAYRARPTARGVRRPVPSGGALYPLELYVLCRSVDGAPAGVLHYDPFAHRLELLDADDRLRELAAAFADPAVVEHAALAVVVTAMPWRSRFKYGARGYRFALLEAGHVAQNLLLACAALRLRALPLGGFYDRALEAVVGANGVDEIALYVVSIGGRKP